MALQLRRGTNTIRPTITPAEGELLYTTDTKKIYVGDGATAGGTLVSNGVGTGTQNALAYYSTAGDQVVSTQNIIWSENAKTLRIAEGSLISDTQVGPRSLLILNSVYNNAGSSAITFNRARGTESVPLANVVNDQIGDIIFKAHDGKKYITASEFSTTVVTALTATGPLINATFASKTGTGPYYVTLTIPTQVTAPIVSKSYTVAGNSNTAYNGSFTVTSSTVSSITLYYLTDPGTFGTGTTTVTIDPVISTDFSIATSTGSGNLQKTLKLSANGVLFIGPQTTDFTTSAYDTFWSGQVSVTSTQTNSGQTTALAQLALRTYADTSYAQSLNVSRYRGTLLAPTAVQALDQVHLIKWLAYDGAASRTVATLAVTIDGTPSVGFTPGAISLATQNSATGTVVVAVKVDSSQNVTFTNNISVGGNIITTSTPGVEYNHDASGSQVSLTLGQTVAFANFSGSVLVNCQNSGTVSQYLCGGGGTPICIGSSKVTQTGTMDVTSGISGYTFTATESGIHSFYVVRTRTGA